MGSQEDELFYICDLRPQWRKQRYITFWRPENKGYAWPLPWSGKYTAAQIDESPDYYTKKEGRYFTRFAVPCAVVEVMGGPPGDRDVDGNVGPVVFNTPGNRSRLLAAMRAPADLAA